MLLNKEMSKFWNQKRLVDSNAAPLSSAGDAVARRSQLLLLLLGQGGYESALGGVAWGDKILEKCCFSLKFVWGYVFNCFTKV